MATSNLFSVAIFAFLVSAMLLERLLFVNTQCVLTYVLAWMLLYFYRTFALLLTVTTFSTLPKELLYVLQYIFSKIKL